MFDDVCGVSRLADIFNLKFKVTFSSPVTLLGTRLGGSGAHLAWGRRRRRRRRRGRRRTIGLWIARRRAAASECSTLEAGSVGLRGGAKVLNKFKIEYVC